MELVETTLVDQGDSLLSGRVEIELDTDGGLIHASLELPPGSPERPPTEDELGQKVALCLADSGVDRSVDHLVRRRRAAAPDPDRPLSLRPEASARPTCIRRTTVSKGTVMEGLSEEEVAIVEVVGEFVDRDVRPVVQELEHANTYPEELIESMKQLGIYGLGIDEPWGEAKVSTSCYVLVTEELSRGWMSLAGAMGGHTVVAKLIQDYGTRGAEGHLLAAPGDRGAARHDGAHRARRRFRPAGDAHQCPP